jgi:acyl carrier protein phosphodiesterase
MNFLAHAYLSFDEPEILAGNMISDFVKGKKQYDYAPLIQKGIRLHRAIDTFTDDHPCTKEIKKFFSPAYRLYAGAFTDIVYDYFLANDPRAFPSAADLENFTRRAYTQLAQNLYVMPAGFQQVFPHMQKYNWLYNYRFDWGIRKSFNGMASRAKYITESDTAYIVFMSNLHLMQPWYDEFFPMLKKYAAATLEELLNTD